MVVCLRIDVFDDGVVDTLRFNGDGDVSNAVKLRIEALVPQAKRLRGKGEAPIALLCAPCVLAPNRRLRHNFLCVFARDKSVWALAAGGCLHRVT